MSTGDPDADAVIAGVPAGAVASQSATPSTGDPDADAAIRDGLNASEPHRITTADLLSHGPSGTGPASLADTWRNLKAGVTGAGEGVLHAASGSAMNLVGAVEGHHYRDVEQELTYPPQTEAGKGVVSLMNSAGRFIGTPRRAVTEATGIPELGAVAQFPVDMALARLVAGSPEVPKGFGADAQSMGAASASGAASRYANASPELQAARTARIKAGQPIEPVAEARHLEADSLPVRMQLTEGQATQNPAIISTELNHRGATGLSQFLNEQNSRLVQNVQAIRDTAGPDVFSTNPVEHADTIINAYKAKDAAAQTDIAQKYQALRDANGGKFPVDAKQLLDNATANLHDKLLFDHAPKEIMSTLGRLADNGSMTFENFESLRTNLARTQRSMTVDGNTKAAAGVIRDAMENMPLAEGAAKLKPLADTARAAAKAQFDALRGDPAYDAAVNDKVSADRFISRFVINGARDDIATMRQNLSDNPQAQQTMGVSVIDHLRQQAGIDPMGNGNFSQANFNKHLQSVAPKMSSLVDPATANQLETLGNVARYTQAQPRGHFANNSNTLTGAIAEHAGHAIEGALNYKTGGIPIASWVRKGLENRALQKELETATAPLAGVQQPPVGPTTP